MISLFHGLSLAFVTDPTFFRAWICWNEPAHYRKKCSGWRQRGCRRLSQQWQDQRQRVCMGSWGEPYHIPLFPTPHLTQKMLPYFQHHHFQAAPSEVQRRWTQSLHSCSGGLNWHGRLPPQQCPKLWRLQSPPMWHPFAHSWGASRGYTNAGLRGAVRDHQPHMLPSVHMCTEIIWGWGWCVPPVPRLSSTQMPLGITGKFIAPSKFWYIFLVLPQIWYFLSMLKVTSCVFIFYL